MGIGFRTGVRFSSPPPAGACPCTQSALLYVRRIFYCRSSILSKTQPLFLRGGHFPSRFFVNTQSHRCDNLCVTFTNSGACPCTQSALLYVRRFFYCRSSILSKTQPLFLRGGHFPSRFFVNTQSHRCDNMCVTFTNSGACPCTRSALLYVRRFFISAHGSLFINPTLLFHHGRR